MVEHKLHIAILGTRGIPNRYGGFEQCAEYLSVGLVALGHKVTVYNTHNHEYQKAEYKGVHIVYCQDWEPKLGTTGQFIYDLNCTLHARKQDYDICIQLGYTSSSIWYKLWSSKQIHITNMDGLEHKRSKFSPITQAFLKRAEQWAIKGSDLLIADNKGIQDYLRDRYKVNSKYIAYGAEVLKMPSKDVLLEYNLNVREYDILIARMEPENNIEIIIEAYLQSNRRRKLVIVGKTTTPKGQLWEQKYSSEKGIYFLGGIYQQEKIHALRYYSKLYFHGHSVGGTNPSLLEAMMSECLIVAFNVSFNKYVLGNNAIYFNTAQELQQVMDTSNIRALHTSKIEGALATIRSEYGWQKIIKQYERLMLHASTKGKTVFNP